MRDPIVYPPAEPLQAPTTHPCPECGQGWPNAPKRASDDDGVVWWRCYNDYCPVLVYVPGTGQFRVGDRRVPDGPG